MLNSYGRIILYTFFSFQARYASLRQRTTHFICIFLAIFVPGLLVACGSPSVLPTTYITADQAHLAIVSWLQIDQDISGTWNIWSAGMPEPLHTPLSGQIQGNTITITVEGSVLQGDYMNGYLTLHGTTSDGQFQNSLWSPISQAQAHQFSIAFLQNESLRVIITQLHQTITHAPTDSNPYSYAGIVQSAQSYVVSLQQRHDQLLALKDPCGSGALALFRSQYPPDGSLFTLSNVQVAQNTAQQNTELVVHNSTVIRQLHAVQAAWKTAHTAILPHIQVSLAWQVSQSDEVTTVQQGQMQIRLLEQGLNNDFTSMIALRAKAQHFANDVQNLARRNKC